MEDSLSRKRKEDEENLLVLPALRQSAQLLQSLDEHHLTILLTESNSNEVEERRPKAPDSPVASTATAPHDVT